MNPKAKFHKSVGEYFRKKREKSGLSQEEVAKALVYTNTQMVSNWERGKCSPPQKALKSLMKLYKINKKELIDFLVREESLIFKHLLGKKRKEK